ncbi:MAG: diaminopimelate aminotransferase, partial [Thermotoga sp.]
LKEVRGIEARVGGIGGGTCAAFFRRRGFHTAVWSTIDETAHQPNEYKRIDHMVEDAKIFAKIAI